MVLRRLRSHRSDRDLRRKSVLANSTHVNGGEQDSRDNKYSTYLSPSSAALSHGARDKIATGEQPARPPPPPPPPPEDLLSPQIQEQTAFHRRFSMLRFRNASDSQLSARAKQHEATSSVPPIPIIPAMTDTPSITMTAPAMGAVGPLPERKRSKLAMFGRRKSYVETTSSSSAEPRLSINRTSQYSGGSSEVGSARNSRVTFDEPGRLSVSRNQGAPATKGEEGNSSLSLPRSALSESSRSERSSADRISFITNTTHESAAPNTTLFKLPRRKKSRGPLFPLPVHIPAPESFVPSASTHYVPNDALPQHSPDPSATTQSTETVVRKPAVRRKTENDIPSPPDSASHLALASASINIAGPAMPLLRRTSRASAHSVHSTPAMSPTRRHTTRARSSTLGSSQSFADEATPPTPPPVSSSRTSFSTLGRRGLNSFTLSFRKNSGQHSPHQDSPGPGASTSNLSNLVAPVRQEGETAGKYLERIQSEVDRRYIGALMSKSEDEFSKAVLRSFMRTFAFFQEPLDMSMRKLMMTAELPKETQQIHRMMEGFADRYHECNPGIFLSSDQVFLVAYATLILHTDVHNKNVKRRNVQKPDYLNMLKEHEIADEVLSCYYDNISYTPFIRVDEDDDLLSKEKSRKNKAQKVLTKTGNPPDLIQKASKQPLDPYILILESNLDILRPGLKDVLHADVNPYSYTGTAETLDHDGLRNSFAQAGVLSILSARSRPEAFKSSGSEMTNANEGPPGLQRIRIAKAGLLWRKDPKKKDKPLGPWREWGALLTTSQLVFFKDPGLAKSLMHQNRSHLKEDGRRRPVIYRPALEEYSPDSVVSVENAIALTDVTYKKHKNAFVLHRHKRSEIYQEIFLADDAAEMNDWVAKLNYAATFRTTKMNMEGADAQRHQGTRPGGSSPLETQIAAVRKPRLRAHIVETNRKLVNARKQLAPFLRNARHLQILAPIQPRTRDEVIRGAGRLSARLQWWRMELARHRCYKTILMRELGESDTGLTDSDNDEVPALTTDTAPNTAQRPEKEVDNPINAETSDALPPVRRDSRESESGFEEAVRMPTNYSLHLRDASVQGPFKIPRLPFQRRLSDRVISDPPVRPSSRPDGLVRTPSAPGARGDFSSPGAAQLASRVRTPPSKAFTSEEGPASSRSESPVQEKRSETPSEAGFSSGSLTATPSKRPKVRLSFPKKTLRESPSSSHHRSRKGRESISTVVTDVSDSQESEGLARANTNFRLHGKKASVIQLGLDWQKMSADERYVVQKDVAADGVRLHVAEDDDSFKTATAGGSLSQSQSTARPATATAPAEDDGARTFYLQDSTGSSSEDLQTEQSYHTTAENPSFNTLPGLNPRWSFFDLRAPADQWEDEYDTSSLVARFEEELSDGALEGWSERGSRSPVGHGY